MEDNAIVNRAQIAVVLIEFVQEVYVALEVFLIPFVLLKYGIKIFFQCLVSKLIVFFC